MKIDLGCGKNKHAGYYGIDRQALPGVDLVCDINGVIPLPDNCADEVIAYDVLEHVQNDKRIHIMSEVWRILKPGRVFTSSTPNAAEGQGAFQDPTHYAFWTKNSFLYYTDDAMRGIYNIKPKFDIIRLDTTPVNFMDVGYVNAVLRAVK